MVLGRSIPLNVATQAPPGRHPMTEREQPEPADIHRPVMLDEVTDLLRDTPAGTIVDATVGMGGHAERLLESRSDCRLVGLDRDADALQLADLRLSRCSDRYELCQTDYRDLPELAARRGWASLSAVLVDLGVSSLQLGTPERGFSFRLDGPLDMRMDRRQERTAAGLVNRLDYADLKALIRDYGEEPRAARIGPGADLRLIFPVKCIIINNLRTIVEHGHGNSRRLAELPPRGGQNLPCRRLATLSFGLVEENALTV